MSLLSQVKADFKRRENVDIYATIVAAFAVAVLSFFDVLDPAKVSSLTLIVLAILALNSLATRAAVEKDTLAAGVARFLPDFPAELRPARESSHSLLLIGVSLFRTLESSFGAFETSLKQGAHIRVLLTHPDADAAAVDARCQLRRPEIEDLRQEIRGSLRSLRRLAAVAPPGTLEVRLTGAAMKFGLNRVSIDTPAETLYVQLYSFRLQGESRPLFVLTRRDGEWFDCYKQQSEDMWADAEVHVWRE